MNQSDAMKKRWADPAFRDKMTAAQSAGAYRRWDLDTTSATQQKGWVTRHLKYDLKYGFPLGTWHNLRNAAKQFVYRRARMGKRTTIDDLAIYMFDNNQ